MLRVTRFILRSRHQTNNLSRNYLTQQFKTCMESQVELKDADIKKNNKFIAFETESFISNLKLSDDSQDELHDRLLKLRSSEETTTASQLVNYAIIHYLSSVDMQGLLTILANRLQYGIFVDEFTGCYLMDLLLKSENYRGAAQIAIELMLQEDFGNGLVTALALESCFKYANVLAETSTTDESVQNAEEQSTEKPIKIRVKYLRNPRYNPFAHTSEVSEAMVGEALLKFSSNCKGLKHLENIEVMANILLHDYQKALSILKDSSNQIRDDVAKMSLKLIELHSKAPESPAELADVKASLEKALSSSKGSSESFGKYLQENTEENVKANESNLIKNKNENFSHWCKLREEKLKAATLDHVRKTKEEEIEKTLAEIEAKRQLLWFFDLKDQLDLEIYKKKVTYPKRWFGKKKKPRVIDDNYVPPEIRQK